MAKYNLFRYLLLFIGISFFYVPALQAQGARVTWKKNINKRTGLYTTTNSFIKNGFSISGNAMYYFGDVDNEGVAFNGGFNKENVSYGGSIILGYLMPAGTHCNMRYTLMGGTLSGNNKVKFDNLNPPRDDYRRFKSIIIQPAVGVEYYPFSNAGLYLYGGVALTASIIREFEFYYYQSTPSGKVRNPKPLSGKTFGFLPMIQLGLGYSWYLSPSWTISAELLIQEGVIDTHYMNLDAYPLAPSQNSEGIAMGGTFGTYIDRYGKEQLRWNDGWFQVGITIAYRWSNCEECRILNNYNGIRGRRW